MKILFLTDGITPFVNGGMQRHSQLVIESLARLGHHVTVYHYTEPGESAAIEDAFSRNAQRNMRLRRFDYEDNGKIPGHYIRAQKEISRRYLNDFESNIQDFDFIYTKGYMGWALLNSEIRNEIQAPIAVKFHGMNMFQKQPDLKSHLSKYLLRPTTIQILEKADYVFSYGGKITSIIRSQCDTPIIEMPTGIESHWLGNVQEGNGAIRRFLFVGRFDRVKGLPELYKALQVLVKERTDWEFHFIGPIPETNQIDLKQAVYHGAIYDQAILKKMISENDFLVNCSISEGMPNVILEAMARGLGIIATDVGASAVLVKHMDNGLLLSQPSVEGIIEALISGLQMSDEELLEWKRKSLEYANAMTWESIGPKLESAIQKCAMG